MYCHHCGNNVPAGAAFCGFCGRPQNTKAEGAKNILFYVFGAVFLLGGLLPYLIRGDSWAYGEYIIYVYKEYDYSQKAMAAISALSSFVATFASLFFFASSALAFYAGLLLVKKERRYTTPVLLCAVLHGLSSLTTCIAYFLIHQFPQFVLSLYNADPEVISLGAAIMKARPTLLYPYQQQALLRLGISLVLVALSIVMVVCRKKWVSPLPADSRKPSTLGNPLMLLGIAALSVLQLPLTNIKSQYFGNMSLAADSTANAVFGLNFSLLFLLAFFAVIAVAVIFPRTKRWIPAIPVVGGTLLLGAMALLLSPGLMEENTGPAELLALSLASLRGHIVSCTLILLAVFFWFQAVARNQLPTWLQILLPVAFPIVYAVTAIITNVVFYARLPLGIFLPCLVTTLLSLLVRTRQPKPDYLI